VPTFDLPEGSGSRQTVAPISGTPSEPVPLTDAELSRWADLIAVGAIEFPSDLAPAVVDRLRDYVAARRRASLLKVVARAIARDLWRACEEAQQGSTPRC
jgi:hypothetical protein